MTSLTYSLFCVFLSVYVCFLSISISISISFYLETIALVARQLNHLYGLCCVVSIACYFYLSLFLSRYHCTWRSSISVYNGLRCVVLIDLTFYLYLLLFEYNHNRPFIMKIHFNDLVDDDDTSSASFPRTLETWLIMKRKRQTIMMTIRCRIWLLWTRGPTRRWRKEWLQQLYYSCSPFCYC